MGFKKSDYLEDHGRLTAVFATNMGEFEAELFADEVPETVWNFVNLAEGRQETYRKGPFYNGLTFHRVVEDFVIQGGCPLGSGTGGPGYKFADEFDETLRHDAPGVLSMANAGPNTNGSQFFITLDEAENLDGLHAVFGRVVRGLEVVQSIGRVEVDAEEKPVKPVVIESVTIVRPE